jgi:hypothetical protein
MKENDEQYTLLTDKLGSLHTEPPHAAILASKILSKIQSERGMRSGLTYFFTIIFGWTVMPWVRRSMAIASFLLITTFIYQQYQIMMRFRDLEEKISDGFGRIDVRSTSSGNTNLNFMMLRGRLLSADSINISVEDIKALINSYDELRSSYARINRILQKNPDLLQKLEEEYGESVNIIRNKPKV